ncbi:hypothetical protein ILUMI_22399 [Ignelater luminosus]|uniref:BPTI/Kunitz inhibitor domain-containing protein n=1 Tax=Ignelater luminosus TaxID=2038154 RepID=A0A8K0G0K5_IGNLU|nr:hypothetical protein ILUMI_22399 [Ignelater luminosus]
MNSTILISFPLYILFITDDFNQTISTERTSSETTSTETTSTTETTSRTKRTRPTRFILPTTTTVPGPVAHYTDLTHADCSLEPEDTSECTNNKTGSVWYWSMFTNDCQAKPYQGCKLTRNGYPSKLLSRYGKVPARFIPPPTPAPANSYNKYINMTTADCSLEPEDKSECKHNKTGFVWYWSMMTNSCEKKLYQGCKLTMNGFLKQMHCEWFASSICCFDSK